MKISMKEFEIEARAFVGDRRHCSLNKNKNKNHNKTNNCTDRIDKRNDDDSSKGGLLDELSDWQVEEHYHCSSSSSSSRIRHNDDDPSTRFFLIYLSHPPILRQIPTNTSHNDNAAVFMENGNTSNKVMMESEWIFHIVYNSTWQVPVLYFRVQYLDGRVVPYTDVVYYLLNNIEYNANYSDNNNNISNDDASWFFVSEEEHPLLGQPYLYLHPCQTQERLDLIFDTTSTAAATTTIDRCHAIAKTERGNLLLAWLSLVSPAVGCCLGRNFVNYSN